MNLYEQEKRVAEYYAAIGAVVRSAWRIKERSGLLRTFVEQIGLIFGWHTVAVILKHGSRLHLSHYYQQNEVFTADATVHLSAEPPPSSDVIVEAATRHRTVQSEERVTSFPVLDAADRLLYYAALPLANRDQVMGVLVLAREDNAFDDCELDILHDLAEHVSLAIDNVDLYEQNELLLLGEERSRLARDLHDSVNQKLFSLSLVAQGLRLRAGNADDAVNAGLQQIGELAQEALTEMKAIILGLHPHGGGKGVGELLERHAASLGLTLKIAQGRHLQFSDRLETTLWRIGQEALNNIRKHASIDRAEAEITCDERFARMRIVDRGSGFREEQAPSGALGLISMRERALQMGGRVVISSEEAMGTKIEVAIPLGGEGDEGE